MTEAKPAHIGTSFHLACNADAIQPLLSVQCHYGAEHEISPVLVAHVDVKGEDDAVVCGNFHRRELIACAVAVWIDEQYAQGVCPRVGGGYHNAAS